jgi:uncharacterized protein
VAGRGSLEGEEDRPVSQRVLSVREARRAAVIGQMLTTPRPRSIIEVVRGLGIVQMDPTSSVARTEHLVLWARLGKRYRPAELERLLWDEKSLFEIRAHIVPTSDYGVHRVTLARFPSAHSSRHEYIRGWLKANDAFRRYVLAELRRRGPLRTRDLEDRTAAGWRTGGWNDHGNNTAMMLEALWAGGHVMIVGREGQQRLWDLAERRLPVKEPKLPPREVTRKVLERQLRAKGVTRLLRFGYELDGNRPAGWERALADLVREGVAVPVRIEGLRDDDWYAHAERLDRSFRGRTVLLSPFDQLIHDRQRAEDLFDFRYKLEIYLPKARREFGYYVLPILHGERLIGRADPVYDRATKVLRVQGLWAEPEAPDHAGPRIAGTIADLASWLGAERVELPRSLPRGWSRALRADL